MNVSNPPKIAVALLFADLPESAVVQSPKTNPNKFRRLFTLMLREPGWVPKRARDEIQSIPEAAAKLPVALLRELLLWKAPKPPETAVAAPKTDWRERWAAIPPWAGHRRLHNAETLRQVAALCLDEKEAEAVLMLATHLGKCPVTVAQYNAEIKAQGGNARG